MGEVLKYEDIKVHPVSNGWITLEPILYKDIIIREGYYTNGANIPRILWRLIPPNDPIVFPGILVHDYLCDKKQYIKADNYLEKILIESKVPTWKRKSIVVSVRFFTRWIR